MAVLVPAAVLPVPMTLALPVGLLIMVVLLAKGRGACVPPILTRTEPGVPRSSLCFFKHQNCEVIMTSKLAELIRCMIA